MRIPKGGIAVFDSGIGGLTVLNSCREKISDQTFYYYGDNARAPYGNFPAQLIQKYVDEAFLLFEKLNVRAVVIGCNTATTVCIRDLRRRYPFPILGIRPMPELVSQPSGEILVMATVATCNSDSLRRLCSCIERRNKELNVVLAPCRNLAEQIENHVLDSSFDYTPYFPIGAPTTVVLGCTHYHYVKKQIEAFYGCPSVDGRAYLSEELLRCLTQKCGEDREGQPLVTPKEYLDVDGLIFSQNLRKEYAPIYFLGSGRVKNKSIYEQMFAIPYK